VGASYYILRWYPLKLIEACSNNCVRYIGVFITPKDIIEIPDDVGVHEMTKIYIFSVVFWLLGLFSALGRLSRSFFLHLGMY
jgi:hypothetical protein